MSAPTAKGLNVKLTQREWGVLMRCLMDRENVLRNGFKCIVSTGDPEIDRRWKVRIRDRADEVRAVRGKLREQRAGGEV